MSNWIVIAGLLMLMACAYQFGLARSKNVATHASIKMHSRPGHYGLLVALWAGLPALAVVALWLVLEPGIIRAIVTQQLPPELGSLTGRELETLMRRVQAIASGYGVSGVAAEHELAAAAQMARMQSIARLAMITMALALSVGGLVWAWRSISPRLRARNQIEAALRVLLIMCSAIAILTTVGIVLSMIGEALHFFSFVHPVDFFFGTTWNPRFSTVGSGAQGEFGLLPLLWGTLMVSLIALLVAVPTGLMTAIYLAEYAPAWLRSFAKPMIEVLAGVPTIVYGFFALVTVGPFFYDVGQIIGVDIRATSALTAGVVMGIMIIPFISSLSDDIITQVPKTMRDGSLGLGATRSETIRRVVLPAALPGIVGAFLLAASRAIGETMIVVLAAGNSPVLHANPFEPVSTVTVTIVNQLTGDLDFASPQSLVAFALGLTLFVITLCLNVLALYIVRKYREQYE